MLYFPRNRSITRYFSFTSFQLRTENFAATPPAFAALPTPCAVFLLRCPAPCGGVPWDARCIQLPAFVPSFAVVPSGSSLVAFPDRSWLLFRHMSPLDYVALVQFQPIAPPLCTAVPYRNPPVAVSILRQEAPFFLCPLLGKLSTCPLSSFFDLKIGCSFCACRTILRTACCSISSFSIRETAFLLSNIKSGLYFSP